MRSATLALVKTTGLMGIMEMRLSWVWRPSWATNKPLATGIGTGRDGSLPSVLEPLLLQKVTTGRFPLPATRANLK